MNGPGRGEGAVLAIDWGSSSVRSVVVDGEGHIIGEGRAPVRWKHPRPGWVELDPVAAWDSVVETMHAAIDRAELGAGALRGIGVTTHRETVVVWDRRTGLPVHDAVVWISAQTDDIVQRWSRAGLDAEFPRRTGLHNDSFFSAAKIVWLLENDPELRSRAEAGELAAGTPDTWLLWQLTGGRSHVTDPGCASRTALLDLRTLEWDAELCALLGVPLALLPEVVASDSIFSETSESVLPGQVPVTAVLADQQASMYGQACFERGAVKNTFGTAGVFTLNTGEAPAAVNGLTSSAAWTVGGTTRYEAEGVVFHSGQTIHWLRDSIGVIDDATDIDHFAASVPDAGGVHIVPAFGGLAAPHWDRRARASITGLTLATTGAHLVRAAVEAMVLQTVDILDVVAAGGVRPDGPLKVDGGGSRSELVCQLLADLAGRAVARSAEPECTALGVASVAGAAAGLWESPEAIG
ncbi:MAG: FGGY family carbohydrate kinase, partial [Janthinobacterium lividum]